MSQTPLLLKKPVDPEIEALLEQAFIYLNAYKSTNDWGYLPTAQDAIAKISRLHMRSTHGKNSSSKQ